MLFVRNENQGSARGESERLPLRAILKKVWHFMKQHKMLSQMLAYHFVIIGEGQRLDGCTSLSACSVQSSMPSHILTVP